VFSNILVPTDGGALARKATRAAAKLAKSMKAKVTSVYVSPPFRMVAFDYYVPPDLLSSGDYDAVNAKSAARFLGRAQTLCKDAGVSWEGVHVADAEPYRAIIALARRKRCDLILMASHGRRGIAGLLLGSETQKVLTHSKIPVLVYR
jgi:nucleotide-binding universal stress UspA family protein